MAIIDLTTTIVGHLVDNDFWLFEGINAERVHDICGLPMIKSFGGVFKAGFKISDECLYTPKIVKAGFKICILS